MDNTTIFAFRKRSDAETLALAVQSSDAPDLIADALAALAPPASSSPVTDYMAFAARQEAVINARAQETAEALAAIAQVAAFSTPPVTRGWNVQVAAITWVTKRRW